jgi:hypothetical protein
MILPLLLALAAPAGADTGTEPRTETQAEAKQRDPQPYGNLLSLEGGYFRPDRVEIRNLDYTYAYDTDARTSFQLRLSDALRVVRFGGQSLYVQAGVSYSLMRMRLPASYAGNPGNQSLSLNLFGLEARLSHAWESCPIRALIPFWDAGYRYTYYEQSGPSELEAADGGVGNVVVGGGLRYWLNRPSSFEHLQSWGGVFLTARAEHIFNSGGPINLASTNFLGGLAVAF